MPGNVTIDCCPGTPSAVDVSEEPSMAMVGSVRAVAFRAAFELLGSDAGTDMAWDKPDTFMGVAPMLEVCWKSMEPS